MLPPTPRKRLPWNKGRLARAKLPLRPKHVWSAWMTLQIEGRARDLTMFNRAIGSKLRESNLAHDRPLRANGGRYEAACSCRNWCSSPDLRQTALAPTPEDGQGFGLGFAVRNQAGRNPLPGSPGEFYWLGIYGTTFWVDPKEKLIAVLMMQVPPPAQGNHYRSLLRIWYIRPLWTDRLPRETAGCDGGG